MDLKTRAVTKDQTFHDKGIIQREATIAFTNIYAPNAGATTSTKHTHQGGGSDTDASEQIIQTENPRRVASHTLDQLGLIF